LVVGKRSLFNVLSLNDSVLLTFLSIYSKYRHSKSLQQCTSTTNSTHR